MEDETTESPAYKHTPPTFHPAFDGLISVGNSGLMVEVHSECQLICAGHLFHCDTPQRTGEWLVGVGGGEEGERDTILNYFLVVRKQILMYYFD